MRQQSRSCKNTPNLLLICFINRALALSAIIRPAIPILAWLPVKNSTTNSNSLKIVVLILDYSDFDASIIIVRMAEY
jgi:hypothetical protein